MSKPASVATIRDEMGKLLKDLQDINPNVIEVRCSVGEGGASAAANLTEHLTEVGLGKTLDDAVYDLMHRLNPDEVSPF